MSPKKTKIILNPTANMGQARQIAADLRPIIEKYGGADWAGTVYPTHATELALQAGEEGYKLVIAAGGDGTVHEIVNGLMQVSAEIRPRLGVLPLGSGNDFSHTVGMKESPHEALNQIFTGNPRRIDIGVIEDDLGRREYWDNTVGIGFDTTVTLRSHTLPLLRGFIMYLTAVLQTIMLNHEAPRMHITSDEESWTDEIMMLVICNGPREGGGFLVAPEAIPDDGLYHYACIGNVSRLMMLRLVPEVMKGTHGRFSQVRMGQLKNVEIKADDPIRIHTDGEIFAGFGTEVRNLKIEMMPGEIEVVV